MALTDKLTAIADAIREKDGTTDTMTLAEMPIKIAAIQTGGGSAPGGLDFEYGEMIGDGSVTLSIPVSSKKNNFVFIIDDDVSDGVEGLGIYYAVTDAKSLSMNGVARALKDTGLYSFKPILTDNTIEKNFANTKFSLREGKKYRWFAW